MLIIYTESGGPIGTYPVLLMFLLLLMLFSFLWCWCVDFLKRSAKQKWNWRLAFKIQNKRTGETIIVNTPSEASNYTYPTIFMLLLPLFSFLWCLCVDCLKISVIQKWNWILAENGRNIRTAEALIVNNPSGDRMEIILWCCCWCCYLFCAIAAKILSIKKVPLNF